jgi:hypothetical protein
MSALLVTESEVTCPECGHRSTVHALNGKRNRLIVHTGAEHVEQRQVMLGSWHGKERVISEGLVIDEPRMLTPRDQLARVRFEPGCPVIRFCGMTTPRVCVQVVDNIAAAHQQNTRLPQLRSTAPQLTPGLEAASYKGMTFGVWACNSAILFDAEGCVLKNSAGPPPC